MRVGRERTLSYHRPSGQEWISVSQILQRVGAKTPRFREGNAQNSLLTQLEAA